MARTVADREVGCRESRADAGAPGTDAAPGGLMAEHDCSKRVQSAGDQVARGHGKKQPNYPLQPPVGGLGGVGPARWRSPTAAERERYADRA